MNDQVETRSVGDLLSSLAADTTTLFRKEAELVRAEVGEKVGQLTAGIVSLVAGAICLLAALIVLLLAAVAALAEAGMGVTWASLLVGAVVALLGFILLMSGQNSMKIGNLAPDRAAAQMRKDAELAKGALR
jgi:hypothetical protein